MGGTAPLKFGKAKNVQNLVRFRTTFDFDCEYLWNPEILKEENGDINVNPFCIEQKYLVNFHSLAKKL